MTRPLMFDDYQVGEPDSDLAFTVPVPDDWTVVQQGWGPPLSRNVGALPRFMQATSPEGIMTFTIDVATIDGTATLHERAMQLLDAQQMRPEQLRVQQVGPLLGLGATMLVGYPLDLTRVHIAICEGGGRLVQITLRAPERLTALRHEIWSRVVQYFCFNDHRGSTIDTSLPLNDWWSRAQQLEHANHLKEAEELIRANIPHLAFAAQIAHLYQQRMYRLKAEGDREGAAHAHEQASDWIFSYASMATSGGEGAALSYERDQFLKALGPRP